MTRVFIVERVPADKEGMWFLTADEAARFLRRAALDPVNLDHFRAVYRGRHPGAAGIPDSAMFRYLAARLADRDLRVARPLPRSAEGVASTAGLGAGASPAATAPRGEPPIKIRAPVKPPAAAPAPGPTVNVAKQVAALQRAAESGAPFCEQCEQKRREAAGSA